MKFIPHTPLGICPSSAFWNGRPVSKANMQCVWTRSFPSKRDQPQQKSESADIEAIEMKMLPTKIIVIDWGTFFCWMTFIRGSVQNVYTFLGCLANWIHIWFVLYYMQKYNMLIVKLMGLRAERKLWQSESSSFKRPLPFEERVLHECFKEFRREKKRTMTVSQQFCECMK